MAHGAEQDSLERLQRGPIDRYTLGHEVGRGATARVFVAIDRKHDRRVAIKLLNPELCGLIGGERFLSEIRVTASLQHPHILPLYDSGEAEGLLFYVMPYVESDSLRARLLRDRALSIEDALGITRTLATALGFAHRNGIVHRDIKPENILLQDGQPILTAGPGLRLSANSRR